MSALDCQRRTCRRCGIFLIAVHVFVAIDDHPCVPIPGIVGVLVAKLNLIPDCSEILPDMLTNEDGAIRTFALSYATKRIDSEGAIFLVTLPFEKWSPEIVAVFALAMNCEKKTWEVLRKRKPEAEEIYCKKARPWGGDIALDQL